MTFTRSLAVTALAACSTVACAKDPKPTLGAAASVLESASAPSMGAALEVQAASSKVGFTMEAPIEKIYGEAPGAVEGQFVVDPHDVAKSRGLIRVDLSKLYLFQQKREDESSAFSEKSKNPKQNEHMKQWFGIDDAAPTAEREKNRWAQFAIDSVTNASASDLDKLSGATRTITATIAGDLLLHGHKVHKAIKVEAAFAYDGDRLTRVTVKSLEPLNIALKEHDIRPPDANTSEKVLQSWLGLFGKKVAELAPVNLEFTASAK